MADTDRLTAIIIGGGIGGLAAAIALQRIGVRPLVFEQAPQIQEVGAGISLWSNAINALRQLDVGELLHHNQPLTLRRGRGFWRGSLGRPYMRFRVGGSAVEYGRYTYCPLSGDQRHFRQLVINRVGRAYQHRDGSGNRALCEEQP